MIKFDDIKQHSRRLKPTDFWPWIVFDVSDRFGQVAMGDFFSFEAVGETCILKPRDPRDPRANMSAQPSAQPGARCISVQRCLWILWCLSDVCGPSPLKIISIFRCYFHVSWTLVSSEQFVSAVLFNFPCRRGQLRFKLVWLHLCRVARVEALVIRAAQGWSEHWALAGDQPEIY